MYDLALLWLRAAMGLGMALGHGAPKLGKLLRGDMTFADPIGLGQEASLVLAMFGELVCGLLVAAGLATRAALVPLGITMLVAMLIHHAADPWRDKELAFSYIIVTVTLLLTGPGRWSADAWLRRRFPR